MSTTTTDSNDGWAVKFIPFTSAVSSPFWVRYCREKLETIKLSEDPINVYATYSPGQGPPCLQLEETSLRLGDSHAAANELCTMHGKLIGYNTLETFQKLDKNQALLDAFLPQFLEGKIEALTAFVLLTFADLKSHKILYWFGMPALLPVSNTPIRAVKQESLDSVWDTTRQEQFVTRVEEWRRSFSVDSSLQTSFIYANGKATTLSKDAIEQCVITNNTATKITDSDDVYFVFFDPSGSVEQLQDEQPIGWPMRNLVAYLALHSSLGGQCVKILSYRPNVMRRWTKNNDIASTKTAASNVSGSIILHVRVPHIQDYEWDGETKYKVVGWELNSRQKPGPRSVNLRPLLDEKHLAIQAADLNLKLMKWRMIPDLQVDKLQQTKVLLIGAGTLGCNVARVLLGWGVRKFKIVDYGKVSYSNPVRQSLFTLEDCHADGGSGRGKAEAAAAALQSIAADVESEGLTLSIPMPGHPEKREVLHSVVETLDKLVQECDVVYLLTDTRESRWLPTLMAAAHNKMLINAALGLDSWLVIRHGGGFPDSTPVHRYGCYFCNDVVAPENSTRNRTLDQQCTVTRPGLAPIASSMAVELMVSLLHHPKGVNAPAPTVSTNMYSPTSSDKEQTSLGVLPHQIRGSLVSYTMMTPTVPAFEHCTACSESMVKAYHSDKLSLAENACSSADGPSYLEDMSGLTAFRAKASESMDDDIVDWDDADADADE